MSTAVSEVFLARGTPWVTCYDRRSTFLFIFLWSSIVAGCLGCLFSTLLIWNSSTISFALVGSPSLCLTPFFVITALSTHPLAFPGHIRGTYEGG